MYDLFLGDEEFSSMLHNVNNLPTLLHLFSLSVLLNSSNI